LLNFVNRRSPAANGLIKSSNGLGTLASSPFYFAAQIFLWQTAITHADFQRKVRLLG
jgi:hypothetical protein